MFTHIMNNKTRNAAELIKRYRPNWPKPVRVIGQGGFGIVYNTNNGRAMKIAAGNVRKEFNALRNLHGAHYVPHVNKNNYVNINNFLNFSRAHMRYGQPRGGAFLMNKVGGNKGMTLNSYIKKYPQYYTQAYKRLSNIVANLGIRRYRHRNIHGGNVIVTVNSKGNITGMWLIDFGFAVKLDPNNFPIENLRDAGYLNLKLENYVEMAKKLLKKRKSIAKNLALLPKSPVKRGSPRRAKSVSPKRNTPRIRRTKSLP
jgi:hypothetical protein